MAGARHALLGTRASLVVAILTNITSITLTLVLDALSVSEAATGAPLLAAVKAVMRCVARALPSPGIASTSLAAVVRAVAALAGRAVITRLANTLLGLRIPEVVLGAVAFAAAARRTPSSRANASPSLLLAGAVVAAVSEVRARALHTEAILT